MPDYGAWGELVDDLDNRRRRKKGPFVIALAVVLVAAFLVWWVIGIHRLRQGPPPPDIRDPAIGVSSPGDVALKNLRVGDCLLEQPTLGLRPALGVGRCDQSHDAQVIALVPQTRRRFPGSMFAADEADQDCAAAFAALKEPGYFDLADFPSKEAWKSGSFEAVCLVMDLNGKHLYGTVL